MTQYEELCYKWIALASTLSHPAPPVGFATESVVSFNDLPRRVRTGLRGGLDTLGGLVPLSVAVVLLFYALADLIPPVELLRPGTSTEATADAGTGSAAGAGDQTTDDGTQPDSVTIDLEAEAAASVDPSRLAAFSWWWIVIIATTLGLLLVIIVLRRTRGLDKAEEQDLPEFQAALQLWLPLIHARHPTPRSIKRFQNHTRFLAMLLRGQTRETDWLDRLAQRLGYRTRYAEPELPKLEEQKLVALQSLYDFDPEVFMKEAEGDELDIDLDSFRALPLPTAEARHRQFAIELASLEQADFLAFLALRPTVTSTHGRVTADDEPDDEAAPGPFSHAKGPSE